MYEAAEDSFLLAKFVREYAKGRVLDVGVGSGILMEAALTKTKNVKGVDIDKEAINYCKKKKLDVSYSDLFSNVKEKFDLIIFNPPYLPEDEIKDKDLIGGKHGYELIERFFLNVDKFLNKNGKILMLFSSLTNKKKVDEIIKKKFKFKLLKEENYFFEKLFVYLVY